MGSREENPTGQAHLFGDPGPRGAVGPAAVPEVLRATATALPGSIRLGTSSWSFPGWRGVVYDREATKSRLARQGLRAYAQHPLLRTVGIDRTFYAPIPAETFADYAGMVPEDFRFLVKASQRCTTPWLRAESGRPAGDNESYLDPAFAVDAVIGPFAEGLGEKAGPLVFQFPPQGDALCDDPSRFADRLAEFLRALPTGPSYAIELRDHALVTESYFEALASCGARHCFSLHPRMPTLAKQIRLAAGQPDGPVVVRWMLRAGLSYEEAVERYRPFHKLVDEDRPNHDRLAELCLDQALRGQPVVVVANNKAEGSAPRTVFKLAESIVRLHREKKTSR